MLPDADNRPAVRTEQPVLKRVVPSRVRSGQGDYRFLFHESGSRL
jgi:hypothetical protein